MRKILLVALLISAGCSSGDRRGEPVLPPMPEVSPRQTAPESIRIDEDALARSLGIEVSRDQLGYLERSYPTCQAGYGYPSSRDCRTETMSQVQFRLQCRDSEGTISTPLGAHDLTPLRRRSVSWSLHGRQGRIELDDQGYGRIRSIFRSSPRAQRLKLSTGTDFLYLRAGEIRQVVVPANWCGL